MECLVPCVYISQKNKVFILAILWTFKCTIKEFFPFLYIFSLLFTFRIARLCRDKSWIGEDEEKKLIHLRFFSFSLC